MNDDEEFRQDQLEPTLAETGYAWLMRIIAVYSLVFGILYWVRLVGFYPGSLWRFDLMPVPWQVASVTLATLFPFAAIGLWMLASWGVVVWVACACIEAVMYWGMADTFGERRVIVVSHLAVALLYVAFRMVMWRQHAQAVAH